MLVELSGISQPPGEGRRRWFGSAQCDLIVWLRDDDSVRGFQFCYDRDASERALTWIEDQGFSHALVTTGLRLGQGSDGGGTPLLAPDEHVDAARIRSIFRAECPALPADYAAVVLRKLDELAGG